jgi:hypothetical protein
MEKLEIDKTDFHFVHSHDDYEPPPVMGYGF